MSVGKVLMYHYTENILKAWLNWKSSVYCEERMHCWTDTNYLQISASNRSRLSSLRVKKKKRSFILVSLLGDPLEYYWIENCQVYKRNTRTYFSLL